MNMEEMNREDAVSILDMQKIARIRVSLMILFRE
jgi:hypothetical protein